MTLLSLFRGWWGYFVGPLFGGGGSSSSNQTSTQTTNVDKRQVVDTGSVGVSSDQSTVNVSTLDNGAIKNAFDFASQASNNQQATMAQVLQLAGQDLQVVSKNADLVSASAASVKDAYQNATAMSSGQQQLSIGVLVVAGIVAVIALRRKA